MTPVVVQILPCSADEAFELFCMARKLPRWVPGLLRARALRSREDGLPVDVEFHNRDEPTYRLLYSYDVTRRLVAWSPGPGARAGVRGFASFSPLADGRSCEISYSIEGRSEQDSATDTIRAFAAWLETRPGVTRPVAKPPRRGVAKSSPRLRHA